MTHVLNHILQNAYLTISQKRDRGRQGLKKFLLGLETRQAIHGAVDAHPCASKISKSKRNFLRSCCEISVYKGVLKYFEYICRSMLLSISLMSPVWALPLAPGYAVASAHPLATEAGLEILAQGGNAFDAAVAISAVLAVVEPYHSGLGGGGFWLLHEVNDRKNIFLDAREVAPMAASKHMFLGLDGEPIPGLSLNGGLAAAIPGEPAALVYIAKHFGKLPLSMTLAPAIRLAEEGFNLDPAFHYFLRMGDRQEQLKKYPGTAAVFMPKGRLPVMGERLVQKDLANTLREIAQQGHDGFYRGRVARQLVQGVNRAGGVWTLRDLEHYQVKVREPLEGWFHNMKIITAPLPSAGGVGLLTMLNILSDYRLESYSMVLQIHYIVEAMRLAYWQRAEALGDPDFIRVSVSNLLSAKATRALRQHIDPVAATKNSSLPRRSELEESDHTTHFSVLDRDGNRVAATLSVNYIFGSSVVAEGTGVLLNDEMDDFSIKPNVKNVFGLIGSEKNAIAPGKRPLSSMTPTFLEMPDRIAILGTPGGSRIPTMVLLAALAFQESYGAITMASRMRFHHQYLPDVLVFEPDTFPNSVQKALLKMGYHLMPLQQYYGNMQVITWDKPMNLITAVSDPRHIGMAAVVLMENKGGYGVKH